MSTQNSKTAGSERGKGVVANLEKYQQARAHGQRVHAIKTWFAQQHMRTDVDPAAVVCVMLESGGQIHVTGLGIEPEHRRHLADEMRRVADKLAPQQEKRQAA